MIIIIMIIINNSNNDDKNNNDDNNNNNNNNHVWVCYVKVGEHMIWRQHDSTSILEAHYGTLCSNKPIL